VDKSMKGAFMPQRLLPVLTLSLIALFLPLAPVSQVRADVGPTHTHITVDGYSAELVLLDGPAKVGSNLVAIRIHNAAGQPLDHVTVLVNPVAAQPSRASTHNHAGGGHDASLEDHANAESAGHAHANGESEIDVIMTQMEAGNDAGSYMSMLHFDSAGAWQVQFQFNDAGVDHAGSFAITVAELPRDWRLLGAFGGANVLIIVTAGVLKRRRSTTAKRIRTAVAANLEN
jgi:hypothetical protein